MRNIRTILVYLLLVLLLGACSANAPNSGEEGGKAVVYTSFYPMYDFAEKIAGEHAEVINAVPSGMDAHDWEPTSKIIVGLENADVFVYSGAGMEHWVEGVLSSLRNPDLIVVEASQGLHLLDSEEDGHYGHDHDHGGTDPHVWLSPLNAKHQASNICEALVKADPDHEEAYRQNYERFARELEDLDQEYRSALASVENRYLVVGHRAFGYLCEEYDLVQMAAMDYSPDGEPSPAQLSRLIDFAREHPVKVVFYEAAGSSKIADAVAREIGADTGVLYPLESLDAEQIQAGEDYLSIMRKNLQALEQALR